MFKLNFFFLIDNNFLIKWAHSDIKNLAISNGSAVRFDGLNKIVINSVTKFYVTNFFSLGVMRGTSRITDEKAFSL